MSEQHVEVVADYNSGEKHGTRTIDYEERNDGWYINDGSGWRKWAISDATENTVRVLIRKEYSDLY